MQMYGPRQGSKTLPWAKCQTFLEALFICNNIDTNLNKNFQHSYHSFKPSFNFFYFCEMQFEKIRKRKMAQGRVPSPKLNFLKLFISIALKIKKYCKYVKNTIHVETLFGLQKTKYLSYCFFLTNL